MSHAAASFSPENGIGPLAGKVILVTGGNTGIGRETVLQLAQHHPRKIFLAARSEEKGRRAIDEIHQHLTSGHDTKASASAGPSIEWLPLDLTSWPSVKAAAEQVLRDEDRLDILIQNAGVMALPPGKIATGQDIQLGTNHIGHFLLFKLLLPRLEATAAQPGADVRVISVASEANQMGPSIETITSTEKLTAMGVWRRYGASKAANIMFAAEVARRYPQLTAVSIHPGLIKTDLYNASSVGSKFMKYAYDTVGKLLFIDVPSGALNQLWAAAGVDKASLTNGAYYTPVGKLQNNKWARNAQWGQQLWEWTQSELAKDGY